MDKLSLCTKNYIPLPPGTAALDVIKNSTVNHIRFISLMIATSTHVSEEIMGDGPDSWKNMVGLPAEIIDTMGENPVIIDYFATTLKSSLASLLE